MKPEPLKDKIQIVVEIEFNDGTKKLKPCEPYFDCDNVKSAVEWLRVEDLKVLLQHKSGDIDNLTMVTKLNENKDKAFEDVIK